MEFSKWALLFLPLSLILWHLLLKRGSTLGTLLRSLLLLITSVIRRFRVRYVPAITLGVGSVSTAWVRDRHIAHKALVQEGAIFSQRLPPHEGGALYVVSSKGRFIGVAGGKLWGVLRRNLATKVLHTSNLKAFAGGRRRALEMLFGDLQAQSQEFAFTAIFGRALFWSIVSMCFGEDLDIAVVHELEGLRRDNTSSVNKGNTFELMPSITKVLFWRRWRRIMEVHRKEKENMNPLIRARRERVTKELPQQCHDDAAICYVDTLFELEIPDQEEGRTRKLHEDEIHSLCHEFILLGVESTACALEWIMANLIIHPHVQRRLYEEIVGVVPQGQEIQQEDLANMPYLKAVILETLRLHPPITLPFPRVAPSETCIDGQTVKKGQMIIFDLTNVGRDEAVWESPSEFKPERFLEGGEGEGVDITGSREIKMVPFGVGRRLCPGLGLAMLNLEYFLANLVREFRWEAAHRGREIDMTAAIRIVGVMKNPLRVRIYPRQ